MTPHLPEELSTTTDWSSCVIMGHTMPPRDPDDEEDEDDEDEEDDSPDDPPVVREPDGD